MANFFHVDTARGLRAGKVLDLAPRPQLPNADIAACFDREYAGGLAPFGEAYVFGSGVEELVLTERKARAVGLDEGEIDAALNRSTNRLVELVWELVRLAWFRERPSRLQTVFAYDNIDAARDCRRNDFGDETLPIWTVEAAGGFAGDSAWLDLGGDGVTAVARACAYWRGDKRPGSMPDDQEHLLSPPVTVAALAPEPAPPKH